MQQCVYQLYESLLRYVHAYNYVQRKKIKLSSAWLTMFIFYLNRDFDYWLNGDRPWCGVTMHIAAVMKHSHRSLQYVVCTKS